VANPLAILAAVSYTGRQARLKCRWTGGWRRIPRRRDRAVFQPWMDLPACSPLASALTAFRFAPGQPANHAEGEQAILRKRQKERLHLRVELGRLLGSHGFQRETAACVLGRNIVLDGLPHGDRSGLAFAQLLEQLIFLQFSDPIEGHVGGISGETG